MSVGVRAGYKQTEVGVIPEDWEVKQLGELGKIVRGGSPRPAGDPRYFNGQFTPWLTVGELINIPAHQVRVTETATSLTEEGSKLSRTLHKDTVIIANSGATLGVAKLLDFTCCANDGIAAIVDHVAGDKEFVCFYVNTLTKHLREVVATGNGQPNLNTGLISEIAIPFPPLPEQRTIATALSDVDALLSGLDSLIAKKQNLKQAAMQQLLTGQTRLSGFSGEWEVKRLGELAKVAKGRGLSKGLLATSGSNACILYGELFTTYARVIETVVSKTNSSDGLPGQRGDVLLKGSTTTKGIDLAVASALLTDEVLLGGDINVVRMKGEAGYDPVFMANLLTHTQKLAIADLAQGSTNIHLSGRNLLNLTLFLPVVAEQTAIATVLSDMDTELAALQARRDKTRALKQGMMQELLTGRIRLV